MLNGSRIFQKKKAAVTLKIYISGFCWDGYSHFRFSSEKKVTAGPNAEMLQSDFHGSMALLFNSEQSLVYWSFDYNVKFLELSILSRSWKEVATEGTEFSYHYSVGIYSAGWK